MKTECSSPNHEWCDPINEGDILYRTNYLVLSRAQLEAMPKEWQHRFVDMIDEIREEFDMSHPEWQTPRYQVKCKDKDGMYCKDPMGTYQNPNREMFETCRIKK